MRQVMPHRNNIVADPANCKSFLNKNAGHPHSLGLTSDRLPQLAGAQNHCFGVSFAFGHRRRRHRRGWIDRVLLAGVDVKVFDPHPEAERVVGEVIANAERACGLLTKAPLPARGRLTFSPNLAVAVSGAE